MSNDVRFDKSKVTHINIEGLEHSNFEYKEECKTSFFGFNISYYEAGYYYGGVQSNIYPFIGKEHIGNKDMVDIDNKLYYKPLIEVYINKERVKVKVFETIEEARKYCSENYKNIKTH